MAPPPLKSPGNNGHNTRTCTDPPVGAFGIMLFGVRLTPAADNSSPSLNSSSFRKCMSMNNLSQFDHKSLDSSGIVAGADGYASDNAVHAAGCGSRERKRGVPWSEEEHKQFVVGLKKVGKGDWRGISRNFVKTRTPTQVASHAQKYFLRLTNANRRRRRSSLFDITTDTHVISSWVEDQDSISEEKPKAISNKTIPMPILSVTTSLRKQTHLIPTPPSSKLATLNLNHSPTASSRDRDQLDPFISLNIPSEPSSDDESMSRASPFGGFNNNGDTIISVA